jgi:hypothetical protein
MARIRKKGKKKAGRTLTIRSEVRPEPATHMPKRVRQDVCKHHLTGYISTPCVANKKQSLVGSERNCRKNMRFKRATMLSKNRHRFTLSPLSRLCK